MKTKTMFFIVAFTSMMMNVCGQTTSLDLTFTAINNGAYIRLDSIKIMNLRQADSVILYWPDTTLSYQVSPGDLVLYIGYAMNYPVGIGSISNKEKQFQLFQIYPNPVRDQSALLLYLPSKGQVNMFVTDIRGRIEENFDGVLDEGTHSFRFRPGDERIYLINARWNGVTQRIKILTEGLTEGKTCKLEYSGLSDKNTSLKQSLLKSGLGVHESGILDTPDNDTAYTFQFATNIPCPGTPTVSYEGQVYKTIQIFSQCWLKENLNVGNMINGTQDQTNNGIKEKYCYNNNPDSCTKNGGLYQWNEMMQYTTNQGAQGICPPDWHLPTDEEWMVLEGAVDSLYGIGHKKWEDWGYRGYDVGTNLRTTNGWYENDNGTDLFGFAGLPGGCRYWNTNFSYAGVYGNWWASTEAGPGVFRQLAYGTQKINRDGSPKEYGFSVRCLRDY